MGLLDYLFDQSTYGDQSGGLLPRLSSLVAPQPSFRDRWGMTPYFDPRASVDMQYLGKESELNNPVIGPHPNMPNALDSAAWPAGPVGAPAPFADRFNALPNASAPAMASPLNVGGYQMPRIGSEAQFAATPQNAQPAQGQMPQSVMNAQAQMPPQQDLPMLPTFLNNQGGVGAGLRGIANNLHAGPLGALVGGIGSAFGAQDPAQQNMQAQFHSLRQALIVNGESPQAASSKAMVAVMNPEAAKTIIPELFTSKTKLQMVKTKDQFGGETETPYSWNEREQTFTPIKMSGGAGGGVGGSGVDPVQGGGYFNRGVKEYDPSLPADQYLGQFAPDVQAAIKNFARGDSTPTGNARKGWAENIKKFAQTWGDKTGQQVNDQSFFEKKKLKTELGASGNSTMGGILDNGESSFAHLAELDKSFSDLGSASHNFPLGGYIAYGQNAVGSALGGSDTKGKIVAAKQNLMKYGQESTKFYAGTGGGVEERMAAQKTVPPESSSGEEQAAYMEKEKQLMLDRLNNKFDHIRQTLGEEEGNKVIEKKMPTINKNIATIDASIKKLRGEETAKTGGGLPSGWSVKVH